MDAISVSLSGRIMIGRVRTRSAICNSMVIVGPLRYCTKKI
jgi:hypothetical protein